MTVLEILIIDNNKLYNLTSFHYKNRSGNIYLTESEKSQRKGMIMKQKTVMLILTAVLAVLCVLCTVTGALNAGKKREAAKNMTDIQLLEEKTASLEEDLRAAENELEEMKRQYSKELEIYDTWMRETRELEEITGQ